LGQSRFHFLVEARDVAILQSVQTSFGGDSASYLMGDSYQGYLKKNALSVLLATFMTDNCTGYSQRIRAQVYKHIKIMALTAQIHKSGVLLI
jgi:hypothetical protein